MYLTHRRGKMSESERFILGRVVKGGMWLYGTSMINNLSGFVYWMIISRIAGSSVLGTTSAIVGVASLMNGALSLGIPAGIQRYVGKAIGEGDPQEMRAYFWTSAIFSLTLYTFGAAVIFMLSEIGLSAGNITPQMLRLASLLVLLGSTSPFTALIIAHLRTQVLFAATLTGSVGKLIVGIMLVEMGFGWIGATMGYAASYLINLVVMLAYSLKLAYPLTAPSLSHLVEVLRAGLATWIPSIVALAGQWLSVLFIYGVSNPSTTGRFYIAFAISNAVIFLATSMLSLLLPVLSGMKDGRKRVTDRMLNAVLALATPIAAFLIAQPGMVLSLLGEEYIQASMDLRILLLGLIPLSVTTAIMRLIYAYGDYGKVTAIGLSQNIPRIVSYSILTPLIGSIGASTSYTLGAFIGMAASIFYGRRRGYAINLRKIVIVAAIPAALVTIALLTSPVYWPATLILAAASYPVYLKLGVVTVEDVREVVRSVLSR